MMTECEDKVYNYGIPLLERDDPLWFLKIDEGLLELSCADLCIMGQLYGGEPFLGESGYDIGVDKFGLSLDEAVRCGFTANPANYDKRIFYEFVELEEVWRRAIREKREKYNRAVEELNDEVLVGVI